MIRFLWKELVRLIVLELLAIKYNYAKFMLNILESKKMGYADVFYLIIISEETYVSHVLMSTHFVLNASLLHIAWGANQVIIL